MTSFTYLVSVTCEAFLWPFITQFFQRVRDKPSEPLRKYSTGGYSFPGRLLAYAVMNLKRSDTIPVAVMVLTISDVIFDVGENEDRS